MTRIDPLSNHGTSKVFLELCSGPRNPKIIADSLKIKPPPAIEQLRRLQELKIVKLGQKVGRAQNYEIDWKIFLDLFVERAFSQKATHAQQQREEIKTLTKNRYFEEFVKLYVCRVLRQVTLLGAMQEFENSLLHTLTLKKPKKLDDRDKQEFFDKMQLWYTRARESMSICELVFQDSLARTLSPEKFRDF
jgi:DNA-binding Lrp family transcriptional regulator